MILFFLFRFFVFVNLILHKQSGATHTESKSKNLQLGVEAMISQMWLNPTRNFFNSITVALIINGRNA